MPSSTTKSKKTILIVGASIAGLTTAYWLAQYGYEVLIVEISNGLRRGGQPIDIRGSALGVIERMGLDDVIRSHSIDNLGMSKVNREGKEVFRTTSYTLTGGDLTNADIEILRDDLVDIIAEKALSHPKVSIKFNETIASCENKTDCVQVNFTGGHQQDFWIVIGADGVSSIVRKLAFPQSGEVFPVTNERISTWSAPNFLDMHQWQTFYDGTSSSGYADLDEQAPVTIGVMTVRHDTELRIFVTFTPENHQELRASTTQKQWKEYTKYMLAQHPAWVSEELIETLKNTTDFYCYAPYLVRLPQWHQNRIALVGDAGYCPSPFSGQGCSLALIGGYVLAGELASASEGDDPDIAFHNYYQEFSPFVTLNQEIALLANAKNHDDNYRDRPEDSSHSGYCERDQPGGSDHLGSFGPEHSEHSDRSERSGYSEPEKTGEDQPKQQGELSEDRTPFALEHIVSEYQLKDYIIT